MGDMPKCSTVVIRKARKEHKCCECRKVISKGDKYEYLSGVWDEPQSYKTCISCADMRTLATKESARFNYAEEWYPELGNLQEWIREYEQGTGETFKEQSNEH